MGDDRPDAPQHPPTKDSNVVSHSQTTPAPLLAGNDDQTPAAPESRAQLRRLLRGDLRQLRPLWRKAREGAAARRQLRRVTSLGKQARVRGRVFVQNDGHIHIGERVHFVATTVPTELVAFKGAERSEERRVGKEGRSGGWPCRVREKVTRER